MDMDVTFPSSCPARLWQSGFSLVELIISLTVGAILIGIAIPAFSTMLDENRISTQILNFVGHLNSARQAAITSGQEVTLCKSSDGTSCDSSLQWEDGWLVFIDRSGDHLRSADEKLLRVQQRLDDDISIRFSAGLGHNNYVIYKPTGLSGNNGTFTFCVGQSDIPPKAVVLLGTGRIRLASKKPKGGSLTCPQ